MWKIGVDAHKANCELIAKTADGTRVAWRKFAHTPDEWKRAFHEVPKGSEVAIECVGWYQPIFDLLESLDMKPILVHARDVQLIAKSKKKNDRRDAEILCDLLRSDFLPTSHVPSKSTRELRELTRQLDKTTKKMTVAKNSIHRLLERAWIQLPKVTDLFGKKGREFLRTVQVSPAQQTVLATLLYELEVLERIQTTLESEAARATLDDADVHLLLGHDGIGVTGALVLRAEFDNVDRFQNRKKIRANFGLNPSNRDSADIQRRGRITKQGPGSVRKILAQGAIHFARTNPDAKRKHDEIARKRGNGKARVASAGDLLDTVYQVLKTRTPYRRARSDLVEKKRRELAKLAATPAMVTMETTVPEGICVS